MVATLFVTNELQPIAKMRLRFAHVTLLLRGLAEAAWYFKESKVCDPDGKNLYPFNGFKIDRIYQINGVVEPVSVTLMAISHCNKGKFDYQKVIRTSNSKDIDWNRPFCMFNPFKQSKPILEKSLNTSDKTPSSESRLGKVYSQLKNGLRNKIDKIIETTSNGKLVEYSGKSTNQHVGNLQNPRTSLEREFNNLVCYKMARRQKYAKRQVTFYMPGTFVGGLFECPIPANKRQEIFQNITSEDLLKPFDFQCDPSISRPISPLVAQDITNQWLDFKVAKLIRPIFKQTIPYLSTPNSLDPRFSSINSPDMFSDTWAKDIDANENYNYNGVDLNFISGAVAQSADYLHKLIVPMTIDEPFNKMPKAFANTLKNLTLDQQINLCLSRKSSDGMKHIKKVNDFWKNTDNSK